MAPLSRSGNAISAGCRRFSLPFLIAQFAKNPQPFALLCAEKYLTKPVMSHVLNCKDGPIAGGPSTAAPSCLLLLLLGKNVHSIYGIRYMDGTDAVNSFLRAAEVCGIGCQSHKCKITKAITVM